MLRQGHPCGCARNATAQGLRLFRVSNLIDVVNAYGNGIGEINITPQGSHIPSLQD